MEEADNDTAPELSIRHQVTLMKFAPNVVVVSAEIDKQVMADLFAMSLVEVEIPSKRIVLTENGRQLVEGWLGQ